MLAILNMKLKPEEEKMKRGQIINKTSLFQGALMEFLEADYVNVLHEQGLKPYTQNVYYENKQLIWRVVTLNEEAYEGIILKILQSKRNEICIQHDESRFIILEKTITTKMYDELVKEYFFEDGSRYIKVNFYTPTAFKSEGKNVIYPDVRKVFNSLMNKFDCFAQQESIKSDEVLEQLVEYTDIIQYNLRSVLFYMEGVKIPAFRGTATFKVNGPQSMVNLVNLLFRYGEYSGVGMKTAIGMGKINIIEKERV
ncbi:MAG: CRISPR-associated endoribonuclease Cas6 [Lachnospiraceae bacterium]|nr:CRISPR-associated endoribonuclease Cas6 [Lachnospiraceae bacterium]